MFVNKTYLIYYFSIFFFVNAENEWADPPYSLTQEAIDGNVRLEDKKLFIPEDLSINTPVLNLFYNKSEYKLDLHSQILCSFHWITGN